MRVTRHCDAFKTWSGLQTNYELSCHSKIDYQKNKKATPTDRPV